MLLVLQAFMVIIWAIVMLLILCCYTNLHELKTSSNNAPTRQPSSTTKHKNNKQHALFERNGITNYKSLDDNRREERILHRDSNDLIESAERFLVTGNDHFVEAQINSSVSQNVAINNSDEYANSNSGATDFEPENNNHF